MGLGSDAPDRKSVVVIVMVEGDRSSDRRGERGREREKVRDKKREPTYRIRSEEGERNRPTGLGIADGAGDEARRRTR